MNIKEKLLGIARDGRGGSEMVIIDLPKRRVIGHDLNVRPAFPTGAYAVDDAGNIFILIEKGQARVWELVEFVPNSHLMTFSPPLPGF